MRAQEAVRAKQVPWRQVNRTGRRAGSARRAEWMLGVGEASVWYVAPVSPEHCTVLLSTKNNKVKLDGHMQMERSTGESDPREITKHKGNHLFPKVWIWSEVICV